MINFACTTREWSASGAPAVAVLMSGGVDSSVTAALLVRAGYDVVGITMRIPSAVDGWTSSAIESATAVASALGLPHYVADVADCFCEHVLEPFRSSYRRGETPSPCVICNAAVKFGAVRSAALDAFGISRIASGHYARIVETTAGWGLFKAADESKDQSYFLYRLQRDILSDVLFPLGGQTKTQTRRVAAELGLSVAERGDSLELCFAGHGDYHAALGANPDAGPGDVLDMHGRVIGKHKGISHYTIGQRSGLGIAAREPLYVIDIDFGRNTVTLGNRTAAESRIVHADTLNILAPPLMRVGEPVFGKIRSRQKGGECELTHIDPSSMAVRFAEPQHGVTPGQHLVLYSAEGQVLGGGVIVRHAKISN